MYTKKISLFFFVCAIIVLIPFSGYWHPASAGMRNFPLIKGETIGLGRQGLSVTNIPLGVTQAYLNNLSTQSIPYFAQKPKMMLRTPALEVRFLDKSESVVPEIEALVYVYFGLTRAERELWEQSGMDEIAIWFANTQTNQWEMCPTFSVHQSTPDQVYGRLGCLAPGTGYYVLAQGDFGSSLPSTSNAFPTTLSIRASIDGKSHLVINGDTIFWHHLDLAAPGRNSEAKEPLPTYLNQVAWQPNWIDLPDTENRDCNCTSSSYWGIPSLAHSNQPVRVTKVQGRGDVIIYQKPNIGNQYTLIIEFDDESFTGSSWYEINLNYPINLNP
jgi:hypothetical protein